MMAFLASGAFASIEQEAVSTPVAEVAAPVVAYELPPSPSLAMTANGEFKLPELKPVAKPKQARKNKLNKTLLSRTVRTQMALLSASPKQDKHSFFHVFDEEDLDFGADELDLHRSFSRPRVVDVEETGDENDDLAISEHARVRLLMARMKALEAHRLSQEVTSDEADAPQAGLTDAVKLRLFLARQQAIRAHEKKFS